jgi:hypothetical protein
LTGSFTICAIDWTGRTEIGAPAKTEDRNGGHIMESPKPSESGTAGGPPTHNREILRLVDLMHHFEVAEQKDVPLQNLMNHLTQHFPAELLPVMDRLSRWDSSGTATMFYARAALQKDQAKLAQKIIEPVLAASGAANGTLLLGSRIYARVGDTERARKLLDRIPADSGLEKGIREVEGKIDAVKNRDTAAPKLTLKKRAK